LTAATMTAAATYLTIGSCVLLCASVIWRFAQTRVAPKRTEWLLLASSTITATLFLLGFLHADSTGLIRATLSGGIIIVAIWYFVEHAAEQRRAKH
jgi:hypothetical protein